VREGDASSATITGASKWYGAGELSPSLTVWPVQAGVQIARAIKATGRMSPMLTSPWVRTAGVSSLVGALLLLPASPAAAVAVEPAATSARLEVQALPDCTTREELAARVAARSRRIHFDDDKPGGPTIRTVIAPAPHGGAVGELVIVQPDGRSSSRRLSAASCAEATDAIALIIALTLDPMSASAASAPTRVPPPPAAAPRAPAAPPSTTAPPAPAADREPVTVAGRATSPAATRRRFGGGVAAQEIFGLTPGALPGLGLYLIAALDRDALWSPAVMLAGTHASSTGLLEPGGTAAFTLDAITVDACALRLHRAPVEARACATALYGRLGAAGSETYSQASADRPFAAAGGALLLSLDLGRLFELSGRFGASASLIRDSFAFTPVVFHRTAAVTLAAGLGVGVRFP